jgi:hypothetical protein
MYGGIPWSFGERFKYKRGPAAPTTTTTTTTSKVTEHQIRVYIEENAQKHEPAIAIEANGKTYIGGWMAS